MGRTVAKVLYSWTHYSSVVSLSLSIMSFPRAANPANPCMADHRSPVRILLLVYTLVLCVCADPPLLSDVISPASCTSTQFAEFDKIYESGFWTNAEPSNDGLKMQKMNPSRFYSYSEPQQLTNRPSLSGKGSYLGEATKASLSILVQTIKEFNITTILDIPCGDVNWQMEAYETDGLLRMYVGADVVSSVVNFNAKRFAHHRNKAFARWDMAACELPKLVSADKSIVPFDLLHVRDVLQHLPLDMAAVAAKHILSSGAKYLLATTYDEGENKVVRAGGFFFANLAKPPFSFPAPLRCISTHPSIEADKTCLYALGGSGGSGGIGTVYNALSPVHPSTPLPLTITPGVYRQVVPSKGRRGAIKISFGRGGSADMEVRLSHNQQPQDFKRISDSSFSMTVPGKGNSDPAAEALVFSMIDGATLRASDGVEWKLAVQLTHLPTTGNQLVKRPVFGPGDSPTLRRCIKVSKPLLLPKSSATCDDPHYYMDVATARAVRACYSLPTVLSERLEHAKKQNYSIEVGKYDVFGPIMPKCKALESYGDGDSKKGACGLLPRSSSSSSARAPCQIISLGSNNEWSFEEAIVRTTACRIYTLDCTLESRGGLHVPAHLKSRVSGHPLCIGANDVKSPSGEQFLTWTSILRELKITATVTYLKMDIEGSEWSTLKSIVDSQYFVPMQIAVEFHQTTIDVQSFPAWSGTYVWSAQELLDFSEWLVGKGYYVIDRRDNPWGNCCSEFLISRMC